MDYELNFMSQKYSPVFPRSYDVLKMPVNVGHVGSQI